MSRLMSIRERKRAASSACDGNGNAGCTEDLFPKLGRPAAPAEPLPPGPERLPVTGPGSGVRLQSRQRIFQIPSISFQSLVL